MVYNIMNRMLNNGIRQQNAFFNVLDKICADAIDESQTLPIDLQETEQEYVIQADAPGLSSEHINISFDENSGTLNLMIQERKQTDNKNEHYHLKERTCKSSQRSFYLPNLDENSIDAKLLNGVLTISAKKTSRSKKTVKINCQ